MNQIPQKHEQNRLKNIDKATPATHPRSTPPNSCTTSSSPVPPVLSPPPINQSDQSLWPSSPRAQTEVKENFPVAARLSAKHRSR